MSTVDLSGAAINRSSFSEPETIHDVVESMFSARPEATFLISPETGDVVTFAALRQHAQGLVVALEKLGLSRGDTVAFLMDNGLFTTQLFLGLMYGGFVVVPLNVGAGVSQLSYTLDHSDAKAIYVGGEYRTLLDSLMANVGRSIHIISVDLNATLEKIDEELTVTSIVPPKPDAPALLMYTSGSTGKPKAAVHTHKTILAHGRNSISAHKLTNADRSLLVLPIYHINAECVTLVPTLMSGGSVVVPRRFSVAKFWDWLEEFSCTWSAVVPTIISQLLDWQDPRADQRAAVSQRIRFLRSSSAPLAPSLHREFLEKFPILLIQAMGSSEAGNIFSNPLPPEQNKIGSTGLPWGFETKIINGQGAEVGRGEPGEVLIRGEGLSRGYYKEQEATAAVFDSGGWLHTGDLAYRDEDGYFFMVGRSKELIIKGGVNIAPRQIDDVLESHPAVLEGAAVGIPDHHLGEDVVAFVVLRAGVAVDERDLLSFCEGRLGHFKTPTQIYFASDLPKGPSGKVQRLRLLDELKKLDTNGTDGAPDGFAVTTRDGQLTQQGLLALPFSIEEAMIEIWEDLLKLRQIGIDDNFFALGGTSLLAIQCLSRLREKVPVRLTVSEFFENGTIAELAGLLRDRLDRRNGGGNQGAPWKAVAGDHFQLQHPTETVSAEAIPCGDSGRPYRISPLQERIWFMEQLNPGIPVYNESEAARLYGDLNINALERALNGVIARHETLRTTIAMVNGQPTAAVQENWSLRLKIIELGELPVSEREPKLESLLISEPRIPYCLEVEPAIRATLVRLSASEHVLILMMHHLICDWASMGVVWRELATLYRGFSSGQCFNLPRLPIQHGDYAEWLRQELQEEKLVGELAFWMEKLRGAPALLELPSDRARPLVSSYRGARRRFRVNRAQTESLRQFSRREKKSLFTLFTAALKALIYRYTNIQDISVGIPLAARDRPELQSLIGFILHTHVLRTELSGDMEFRELLARVQKGTLELYEHREAPFDQVVRVVQPERSLSYSPLFQVMLNWRDREQDLSFIGLQGLRIESVLAGSGTSKFDLTVTLTDMADEIWGEIEYSTDLFDETRIERMIGHYQTVLAAVVENPELPLSELPLLTGPERNQLLVEWNKTNADFQADVCLHELFERQAQRTPATVAVEFNGKRSSYRELNERSNQLAHYLGEMGIKPGTLVGVVLERSFEMVVALLAVLKAGGAYVPLDPAYPAERLAFILEETQAPVILTQRSITAVLPGNAARVICLDDPNLRAEMQRADDEFRFSYEHLDPSNLAYVLYTSGSTGKPKGVEISHRSIANFLSSMKEQPGIKEQDVLLSVTTLSFDIFGLEIWLPLTNGATVVIAPPEVTADGRELAVLIERSGTTVMQATPSTWRLLLESGWKGNRRLKILCGGEPWPSQLAEQLLPRCASLWNMYGPTETTIWSSAHPVEGGKPVLIGRPIANTQFYLVDSHLQLVPEGIPGELLIGGVGLARGYLNRPEMTAEKFVPNPFCTSAASRLYRTGDLVRYRADGLLEFMGRIDHQVKMRGYRIELGEIESVLRTHPGISDTVVVSRNNDREQQLVAYIVATPELEMKSSELREYLKTKLPDYMVPTIYVTLEKMPVTPNGKIDRKALPAPDVKATQPRDVSGLPRNILEQQMCDVWGEILSVKDVGIHDNFFDLGGHSLSALKLMLRLQEIIPGGPWPLRALLEAPTVEKFAVWLRNHKGSKQQFLVKMRPGVPERPPLFVLHGAGGNALNVRNLAIAMPADLPVYVFEDKGLDGSEPFATVEETARCFVDELRHVQPQGPYYIGGVCYGGSVAFEMACLLEESGEAVGALILLDSSNPAFPKLISSRERLVRNISFYAKRVALHAYRLVSKQRGDLRLFISHRFEALRKRLRGETNLWDLSQVSENIRRVTLANMAASSKFIPRPYQGHVTLFRASDRNPSPYFDDFLGWKLVTRGKIECFEVKAGHMSMLEQPAVQIVADKLNAITRGLSTGSS